MLLAGVVGVITVGVAGRAVTSPKAMVPFLARFTGQGVESANGKPVDRKVNGSGTGAIAVCCAERDRPLSGAVGVPVTFPLVVFMVNRGAEICTKLSGLPFVLNSRGARNSSG